MAFDYYGIVKEVAKLKASKLTNWNHDYRNNLEADRLIAICEESLAEVFRLQEHPKEAAPEAVEEEKKPEKKAEKKPKK